MMFTDIVGYTALTQRNEDEALGMLSEHNSLIRQTLEEFGGREVKTIGDSFLVEFASALNAVRCAVAIQEKFHERNMDLPLSKRIEIRVGIHVGDVVVEAADIFGDAVNISSRIQPLAEAGGVCISEQVYSQVRNKLENRLLRMGRPTLKGVATPLEVYNVVMKWEEKNGPSQEMDRYRIAVLPFRNMSPDPNDEYFAEGMTEELITAISGIADLAVIARTSVMAYKGSVKRISEIGPELGAGTILEGSVRKAGNRARITVQLIDSASERHLWAQNYDRQLEDIFDVQTEVADRVASSLKLKLFESKNGLNRPRHIPSAEAHEKYLMARYNADRIAFDKAIKLLEEAIRIDPEFALAYSELANIYLALCGISVPPAEASSRASEYVSKALELDNTLSEAWVARGNLAFQLEWDWPRAETSFEKALALNPSCASAYMWYGTMLFVVGKPKEAVQSLRKCVELNPTDLVGRITLAHAYSSAGLHDDAIREVEMSSEVGLSESWSHSTLAMIFNRTGRTQEVKNQLDLFEKELAKKREAGPMGNEGLMDPLVSILAFAYVSTGKPEKVVEMIGEAERRRVRNGYLSRANIGTLYLALGDVKKAFELFEQSVSERDPGLLFFHRLFPNSVQSDTRLISLLEKMNLRGADPDN